MKIVFFGTPQIAADVLLFLLNQGIPITCIITKPDRPKGRSGVLAPPPVKLVAMAHCPSIPIYQPELVSAPEFADTIKAFEADLFVVVAYGEIIKQHLLDMPRLGCINLHASLLPKYRGAAPIQRCLFDGEKETGVTIMHMVKKMDAGDIIKTAAVPIGPNTTAGELETTLCQVGSQALLEVIREFERGGVVGVPQDHQKATFAPKIELEDCEVHWNRPAQILHNLIRGATPHPGAWCYVRAKGQKNRLKIMRTSVLPNLNGPPGEILASNKEGIIIGCGEQALQIYEVQLEGKKAMAIHDLMRGVPLDFKNAATPTQ